MDGAVVKNGGESDHDIFYSTGPIICRIMVVNLPIRFNLLAWAYAFFFCGCHIYLKMRHKTYLIIFKFDGGQ
jgi:hypothetical protein